jgi:CRISPR-associated endonuclease/helicase Cas3
MACYESHRGKLLKEHLREVAEGAWARLDHPALRQRGLLREAAYWIGLTHDLGKYTPYFQAYLKEGKRFEGGLERHAFLGAVLAAWLLRSRLKALPDSPQKEFLPLLGYLTVHRHHGNLVAPQTLLPRLGDPQRAKGELYRALRALPKQLQALKEGRAWAEEWAELGLEEAVPFVEEPEPQLGELFQELDRMGYELKRLPEEEGAKLGLWGQLLFSALIDADKRSAARVEAGRRSSIPEDLVERFLTNRHASPRHELDRQRLEFQQAVRATVENLEPREIPGALLSLTAPTGLGKTYSALDVALRLRTKLKRLWGEDHAPRIVYALPFINIIEQNYRAFREAFRTVFSKGPVPEAVLLRHHYLSEIAYRFGNEDNENLPLDQALMMIEAWESEVIVTTFVQLFQTLLGYQNRFLKKLHNLIGAVVILDEVQALPMEFWPLTDRIFAALRQELGLTVLQMTATRPLIFPKAQELHPDPPALFRKQQRTRLLIEADALPPDAWAERVLELYQTHGSLLCVVNTIRASLEIYKLLRDHLQGRGEPFGLTPPRQEEWLVYLSTNIVPWQRKVRLRALKRHLGAGGRALVISTQVVEAGVDLDFPAVVRDLGPIDAVVQVAGRCNREGQRSEGRVYLLPLEGGGCGRVYGAVHTYLAKRLLLEGPQERGEHEYAELVERYFQEARERLSQEKSEELWRAYTRLSYDRLEDPTLSEFRLIESPKQLTIAVALTPKRERWLLETFKREVLEERDRQRRQTAYLRHRRELHDLTVRPLLQRASQNLPPALADPEGLRWVPYGQLERFYDLETGFVWEPEEIAKAWIE